MSNNVKLLLGLLGLLVLTSGYTFFFCPVLYYGGEEFLTAQEYNTYQVARGISPFEVDEARAQELWGSRFPRTEGVSTSVPRGQEFPYGERKIYHLYIGGLNLVVAVIVLVVLRWEVKHSVRSREE